MSTKIADHKFLFILSPPYCGSTLLNEILCTSNHVSVNNPHGTREGQGLPRVREIMFDHDRRWDETLDFDWNFIKAEWMKHWDQTCPVLLEKSPPNIIRTNSITKYFSPSYFIVLYRNPYAHVESLMNREKWGPERAAEFAIQCLRFQKKNIESLQNTIQLSYEHITENPLLTIKLLGRFLPELSDIVIDKEFTAHNFKNKKLRITNLNDEKIGHLTSVESDRINTVFSVNRDIIAFFKYELIQDHEKRGLSG